MRLKVMLPARILIDEQVSGIVAEEKDGLFCLLENHIDTAAALRPGILSFRGEHGEEFAALDTGILVKKGPVVSVSVRAGVRSRDLGDLRKTVEETFRKLEERKKTTRTAIARLEADFIRRFTEMQ